MGISWQVAKSHLIQASLMLTPILNSTVATGGHPLVLPMASAEDGGHATEATPFYWQLAYSALGKGSMWEFCL